MNTTSSFSEPVLRALTIALLAAYGGAYAQTVSAPSATQPAQLEAIEATDEAASVSVPTPPAYAGGQVGTGGQAGILGNMDAMNTPFIVNSYTSKLIEDQQARTLGEAIKNDPTVQVGNGFGNFAETFVIRGFPLNNDDLAFNGLYGILPRQVLPTEMIERVEIFKGASAFLNGAAPGGSGLGGLINIQPKRGTDEPLTRLNVDYTGRGQIGGGVDIGRRWGDAGEFGIRVNAAHRDGEMSFPDAESRTSVLTLGLDYRGERLRASLDAGYQNIRYDQARPTVGLSGDGVPEAPSNSINYAQPWAWSKLQSTFAVARVEYDLTEDWMAYAALAYSRDKEDGLYAGANVNGDGIGSHSPLRTPYIRNTVTGEVGLRGRFQTGSVGHQVNLGVSALRSSNHSAYEFFEAQDRDIFNPEDSPYPETVTFSGGDIYNPGKVDRSSLRSIAVSDTLSFLDDRVLLTLGLRHQNLRYTAYDYSGGATSDYDKSIITPFVGLVFKPTQNVSLYANYIEGLTRGETAPLDAENRNEVFKPARTKQMEAGVKVDMGDYGASLAVFQLEKPEFYLDSQTNIFSAAGEQRNRGLELSIYGQPAEGVRLIGGVTLMNARLQKTQDGVNDGNHAVGVPRFQATMGAEWDPSFAPGLTLQGYVTRRGAQYVNKENEGRIPGWTRVDLGARYTTKLAGRQTTFRFGVDNVFNKRYWATVAPQFGQLTAGKGRTVKASVSLSF
ncbi:TonB-denpendent receptor [Advenella kashmirensis W13003]|uniref:TonB-denpendent receptor n=1 Tax=Advenella kashmirensis W13003 TaxID=1424334 RepID=V8QQ74_9BURK|nr:TonB-dependent siderophore receptor [Advenella kashmirensis]ETF01498.1 TonB-denpendent receptor [Advenella kashmirensis W13003]